METTDLTIKRHTAVWTQDQDLLGDAMHIYHRLDNINPALKYYAAYLDVFSFELGEHYYIPLEFVEGMDGANGRQLFFNVILPLLKPTILLTAILTMISAFQVFDIIQVMTRGGPNEQTRVMVIDIYDSAFRFQRMGWAAAVSIVLFLLVLIISLVQNRLLRSEWEY